MYHVHHPGPNKSPGARYQTRPIAIDSAVSAYIEQCLLNEDFSLLELSRRTGIAYSRLARTVRGTLSLTLSELDMIAKVFSPSAAELITRAQTLSEYNYRSNDQGR
ncbi:helix-turn-helix domain-containing protein [Actinobaculum massiliense]|uniref:helix-turn-helix domain-containing protein n=1 Tax=Actinobaculum massiliense TaxID=202789 RepID=UPI0035CF4853